jgi:hypothetical protein
MTANYFHSFCVSICVVHKYSQGFRISYIKFRAQKFRLNEELRDLYSSPSIIRIIKSRRMRWARHVARMGEKRNAYRFLVGKPEGKKPLGRSRRG